MGSIPTAGAEDVDAAVAAANAAFASGVWSRTTGAHRATILRAIADKARLCLSSVITISGRKGGSASAFGGGVLYCDDIFYCESIDDGSLGFSTFSG